MEDDVSQSAFDGEGGAGEGGDGFDAVVDEGFWVARFKG